jgi:hypothetical protein
MEKSISQALQKGKERFHLQGVSVKAKLLFNMKKKRFPCIKP